MARPGQTGVQCRGGFRGSYIPVSVLIDEGWTFDIIDCIVDSDTNPPTAEKYKKFLTSSNEKNCYKRRK